MQSPRTAREETCEPFLRHTGGKLFDNYEMQARSQTLEKPKFIADKFLHARFITVFSGSAYLPDGLLVASDHQAKRSLFHMSEQEFDKIACAFLDDRTKSEMDWIDTETGKAHAERL